MEQLFNLLNSIPALAGKVAYYEFPQNERHEMPYCCYYEYASAVFGADNVSYYAGHRVMIDLYIKSRSNVEKLVEDALTSAEIYYEKSIDRDNDQHCYVVQYQVVV